MPTSLASLGSLVHPHQLEVQDFSLYALVIDARQAKAFREDHIPGAVNVPVVPEDANAPNPSPATFAAREPGPATSYELAAHMTALAPGDRVLVYCDRGGLDSERWAVPLRAAGFGVDVLGGGWVNYRRWVSAGLEVLPRALTLRRIVAPPVSGLCRVLAVLAQQGQQVLDIAELAGQRLVPGLTLKGDTPPTQAAFETLLLDRLRHVDPDLPVWVRVGPAPLDTLAVPPALREALTRAEAAVLVVPQAERARLWLERMQGMKTTVSQLIAAFSSSALPPTQALVRDWDALDAAGQTLDALAAIIQGYIDPHNAVACAPDVIRVMRIDSLSVEAIAEAIQVWLRAWPSAGTGYSSP